MKELKPCPFCGSLVTLTSDSYNTHWVMCNNCGCEIDGYPTKTLAIEAWNRRTPDVESELKAIESLLMQHTLTPYSEAMERIFNLLEQLQ